MQLQVPPCVPLCRMAHLAVQGCPVPAAGLSPCGHFCPTDSSDGGSFVQQPPLCSGSHHWQRSLPAHQHLKCLPVLCRVSLTSVGPEQLMALGPLFRSDLAAHRKYGHPPQMLPQTHWALTLLTLQPRSPTNPSSFIKKMFSLQGCPCSRLNPSCSLRAQRSLLGLIQRNQLTDGL